MGFNQPLRLSYDKGLLCGVCAGVARWLEWKPWVVRTLFVLLTIFTAGFPGLLLYLVLYLAMPGPDMSRQPVPRREPTEK